MAKNPDRLAALLGATHIGTVPETGGGAFGVARLARIVAGLRTDAFTAAASPLEVLTNDSVLRKLTRLAEQASTADHKVSPTQVAARLLEEAVASLPEE